MPETLGFSLDLQPPTLLAHEAVGALASGSWFDPEVRGALRGLGPVIRWAHAQ